MTRLEERIRSGLQETAERIPATTPTRATKRLRSSRPAGAWIGVAAVVAVLVLFTPILFLRGSDPGITPAGGPPSPFLGTWVTTDADGSTPTMVVQVSEDGTVAIKVTDEFASVCSGAPSTMTGTGAFESDNELVLPSPVLTCDDGSQSEALSGPPLDEQLQNLTFTHGPQADTLTDSFGSVWTREGADDPTPTSVPTAHPMIRWPQSSLEEVQEAQELADAGDPDYTWQLEPNMESMERGMESMDPEQVVPEIFARVLRKEFGWEEFALVGSSGTAESQGIRALGFEFIRCEPGKSNPLWPNDPWLGECAPTIDDFHYETVEIFVSQPGKRGPEGIWVVFTWSETVPLEQIAPLAEVEIAVILEPFLQARIAGQGAEQYLGQVDNQHDEIGLLYATSTGAPYERAEFEVVDQGWPGGSVELKVRLFAEDQTVVEQIVQLELTDRWALYRHQGDLSTEIRVPLPGP